MKLRRYESLSDYTNYEIGGVAEFLYIIERAEELFRVDPEVLKDAYILGAGTNILVSDEGVSKPVIKIGFAKYWLDSADVFTVEAGALLKDVAKSTADKGLRGLVHVSGIPGSIGGAVVMNASASHGAISDYLVSVQAFNRQTRENKTFQKNECGFGFRKSIFQDTDWVVLNASFKVELDDKAELLAIYKTIKETRKRDYPMTLPSAGCWFKRDWGGREIIRKIGMSGKWKGGAVVSPMFPAFILNACNASSDDIYGLVKEIQERAKEVGEDMPLEIVTWGDFGG